MMADIVMAVGQIGMLVATVPGIIENFKKGKGFSPLMCAIATGGLSLIVVGLLLLGALLSAGLVSVQVGMWFILFLQAYYYGRD